MKTIKTIDLAIARYDTHKDDLSLEQIQELRSEIKTSLSSLSTYFADLKIAADAAEYYRKKAIAEYKESLVGVIDERTSKPFSVSSANDQALIATEDEYRAEREAAGAYTEIRQQFDTANGVTDAMSSHIKILLRNDE